MLIIFDLDDTLIDTSGAIVPLKMRLCLQKLQELGLAVSDFESDYKNLLDLSSSSLRSEEALSHFIERKGGDPHLVHQLKTSLTAPLPDDFSVPTTPNAKEILETIASKHTLALVTGGFPPLQKQKLKKAGIEPSLFSNILIPEDCIKRPSYEALRKQFLSVPTMVCGDRVKVDLLPGHELGFTTVHMKWGRGRVHQTEPWVDYSIADLRELKGLLQ